MSLLNFGRLLLTVVLFCVVSVLLSAKASAGQFTHLVAIVIATDDGKEVVVPVDPVILKAPPSVISKEITKPRRAIASTVSTVTVCGPDGCKEVPATKAAACPCSCAECACSAKTAAPATATQSAVVVTSTAERAYRAPVRRALGRVAKFVVKGGPIRQALRANRRARRGW